MEEGDDRLVSSGALFCQHAVQRLAPWTEATEGIGADGDRPVQSGDDPAGIGAVGTEAECAFQDIRQSFVLQFDAPIIEALGRDAERLELREEIRTFPKAELLQAMNFVIIPALIGPLLGPTVGGLIVHWLSWREIFFVNIPAGVVALWLIHLYMPDYYGATSRPLDLIGLVLFGCGTALLSWLLEIFGEHQVDIRVEAVLFLLSVVLLAAYWRHALKAPYPLLQMALFKVRTFRVSVIGGFITRLGVGGLPFLTPLLFQIGLDLPAWQSGLLMMPTAAAAMGMKLISTRVLGRFGYRRVLIVNTVMIGATINLYSLVSAQTPLIAIVVIGLALGFFNSLQFSSMNSMAYADIETNESSMASTIASSFQQISMSFGLAFGSLVTAWYLGPLAQSDRFAVTTALHHAFLTLGGLTIVSSLSFWTLRPSDGESVSRAAFQME